MVIVVTVLSFCVTVGVSWRSDLISVRLRKNQRPYEDYNREGLVWNTFSFGWGAQPSGNGTRD